MQKPRVNKPFYQKQNQQRYVNKRTDLLSSLNNIKLPTQYHHTYKETNFQSVPTVNSIAIEPLSVLDCNFDGQARFNKQRKAFTLTEEYCSTYGECVDTMMHKDKSKGKFLANHKIDGTLRARMLDWMVEVMSSYNFQNKTYFAGVEIMDRYFAQSRDPIAPSQLHIIGVQSMFIASKMQEVYPLKMKTVFDKIAHKKIDKEQLIEMQSKIAETLDFCLVTTTFYELAITKIARHMTEMQLYSESLLKEMEDVASCIAKFMSYNYDLVSTYSKETLSQALANYILEIYKISKLGYVSGQEYQCRSLIADSISGFKRKNKGLGNLIKFTDRKTMEIVQATII